MNKRLMLIAALTVALGTPVMAHEGESHDEPKTNNQDQDAEKAHKELERKRHDAAEKAGDHKGGDHKDGDHKDAKGAKSKKAMKKKGKKAKAEEPKSEMPAGMPMKEAAGMRAAPFAHSAKGAVAGGGIRDGEEGARL